MDPDNFWIWGLQNGKISFEFDQDPTNTNYTTGVGNIAVNDGNWHHVALSRVNGTASLYIDGNLDISASLLPLSIPFMHYVLSAPCATSQGNPQLEYHGSLWWSAYLSVGCNPLPNPGQSDLRKLLPSQAWKQPIISTRAGGNNTGITTPTDGSGNGNDGVLNNFALIGAALTGLHRVRWYQGTVCVPQNCNVVLTTSSVDSLIVCQESGQTLGSVTLLASGGTAPYTMVVIPQPTWLRVTIPLQWSMRSVVRGIQFTLNVQLTNCIILITNHRLQVLPIASLVLNWLNYITSRDLWWIPPLGIIFSLINDPTQEVLIEVIARVG